MKQLKILCTIYNMFIVISVFAVQTSRVDIPVAMRIDNDTISVPFYISVVLEWCSCNAIDLESTCEQDSLFLSIIECIKDEDVKGVSGKITQNMESESRDQAAKTLIHQLNGSLSKMWVAGRYDGLQNDKIYICQLPNELGNSWFGFRIISDRAGGYVWDGGEGNPLMFTIAESFGKLYENNKEQLNKQINTKYNLGLGGKSSGIYMKINGSIFDYDIFDDSNKCYAEILDIYRNIHKTIVNNSPDISSKIFTNHSGEKYLEWVSYATASQYKEYIEKYITSTRRVFFVLDADPVYIYFYTNSNEYIKSFNYDIIYKEQDGYKYTNFYVYGLADNLIKSDIFKEALLETVSKRTSGGGDD